MLALDLWNGTPAQCEGFRAQTGISYPILTLAGAANIGGLYSTGIDAFFVVDGDGIIRYRRTDGSWLPSEMRPVVDQALDALLVPVADIPGREGFLLGAPHPNPFNPQTVIPIELHGDGHQVAVELIIHDLRGRRVRTLISGSLPGGQRHEITWDGRGDHGRRLASGTYMVELKVGGESQGRFLSLVK
jgi:hypothetical protein